MRVCMHNGSGTGPTDQVSSTAGLFKVISCLPGSQVLSCILRLSGKYSICVNVLYIEK